MSLFDNSMSALKNALVESRAKIAILQSQADQISNTIAPLNTQLSAKQAEVTAAQESINEINSNITDLQKIIDADNLAIANGQTPPSQIFISTYLK